MLHTHYLPSTSRCLYRLFRDRQLHRLLLNRSVQLILPLTRHDFLRPRPTRIKLSLLFLHLLSNRQLSLVISTRVLRILKCLFIRLDSSSFPTVPSAHQQEPHRPNKHKSTNPHPNTHTRLRPRTQLTARRRHPTRRPRPRRPPRLTTTRLQRQIRHERTLAIPHRKRHTRRRDIDHPPRLPPNAIFNQRIHARRARRQRPIRRERDIIRIVLAERDECLVRHLLRIRVTARGFLAWLDGALGAAEPGARIHLVDDSAERVVVLRELHVAIGSRGGQAPIRSPGDFPAHVGVGPADAHAAGEEAVGAHELAGGVEGRVCR